MPKRSYKKRHGRKRANNVANHVLTAWIDCTSGVLGTNGFNLPIQFTYFDGFSNIGRFYHYFKPLRCRVSFLLSQTTATLDSFEAACVAVYPIDYIIESPPTVLPVSNAQVAALNGSIRVQPGSRNVGRWCSVSAKQWYSCADAITYSTNAVAGNLLAYFADIGPNEKVGQAIVDIDFAFKTKVYYNSQLSLYQPVGEDDVTEVVSDKVGYLPSTHQSTRTRLSKKRVL